MSQLLEDLLAISALLDSPKCWIKLCSAADADGNMVPNARDYRARRWCLQGAIFKIVLLYDDKRLDAVVDALGFSSLGEIARWNDAEDRTFEQVKRRIVDAAVKCFELELGCEYT